MRQLAHELDRAAELRAELDAAETLLADACAAQHGSASASELSRIVQFAPDTFAAKLDGSAAGREHGQVATAAPSPRRWPPVRRCCAL